MNEENQKSQISSDNRDDLQQIKGIGQSIARTLNSLNIYRFSDLADFTPDGLADLLKTKISSISPHRIANEDWLGQARILACSQQEPESTQSADDTPKQSLRDQDQDKDTNKASRKNWRELADFFVSFGYAIGPAGEERLQTKVHHSQGDKPATWEGIVSDQLINWMFNQANLPSPPEKESQVEAGLPNEMGPTQSVAEEATLELSDLWVSEVEAPALIASGQRQLVQLRAKSRLNLSGQAAFRLTNNQLPYVIELFLVDTETNQSKLVSSDSGLLTPGELNYEIQQDFRIPPVGRYQFFIIARLLPPGTAATHLQGPIIRVEA